MQTQVTQSVLQLQLFLHKLSLEKDAGAVVCGFRNGASGRRKETRKKKKEKDIFMFVCPGRRKVEFDFTLTDTQS